MSRVKEDFCRDIDFNEKEYRMEREYLDQGLYLKIKHARDFTKTYWIGGQDEGFYREHNSPETI